MSKFNERPDAVTGTTTANNRDRKLVGKVETEVLSYGECDTIADALKRLADTCIEATQEGQFPYAYVNMFFDEVRYGISVSLRYNNGAIKVFTTFVCDEQENVEFMSRVNVFITDYLEYRGINKSKPFMKKVKKNDRDLETIKSITNYMFNNTAGVKLN